MNSKTRILGGSPLLLWLSILLTAGFFATSLLGYFVSREAIRTAIISQDLPLTSGNIYSEIQKDLVRPILVSSMMAHDTFLRDWVLRGEKNLNEMARYLKEVKEQHQAFSSYFISDRTRNYYTGNGILKRISPNDPHDVWYYKARDMPGDYVIDVDTDQANRDAMTIFINYRVHDFSGRYLGITGIGLTVAAVRDLVEVYQERYQRNIYFVNAEGRIVLHGARSGLKADLRQNPGIGALVDTIFAARAGSWQYRAGGANHILHVNYLPELKWYLFVEQNEDDALAEIRNTLYINCAISLVVSMLIVALARRALRRYQATIEELATTDELTGLFNRHAFAILQERLVAELRRDKRPCSILLLDVDHFKQVNDLHGHRVGDQVLAGMGELLRGAIRDSDIAVRWGGEEFLLVLPGCPINEAMAIAESLRTTVAGAAVCADKPELVLTVSIGVSEYSGNEFFDSAIDRADNALYSAKMEGRDMVVRADPPPAQ